MTPGNSGNVDFTDQSTITVGCPITVWLWDFGDGTAKSNATKSDTHDYPDKKRQPSR